MILRDPLLTQNAEMRPAPHNFLHLDNSFLCDKHKLSLMKTFVSPGKFTDSGFRFFTLFLFNKILWISLRRFNFMMTFFGEPLESKRWQASTKLGTTGTSIYSKISKTFNSRPLSTMLSGILKISRHSPLDYCSLA